MPILHSNLETDLRQASRLEEGLRVTLVDMASIRRAPGMISFEGTVNGALTDTGTVRFASLGGADAFAATLAEDTTVAETALTDTSVNIQVVRHALVRNIGDLATGTGSASDITPERLAADMVLSNERRFTDVFATALATAATDVGTSGADMVHDDFVDAVYTLEIASVPSGTISCALHGRQMADWSESLRSEGGALQFSTEVLNMLAFKGQGFQGTMLGVNVWKFSHVTDDSTNRQGGMWGESAFGYKIMIPQIALGAGTNIAVRMDELTVELQRVPDSALTQVAGNSWFGISVLEQARLVGIVTDN